MVGVWDHGLPKNPNIALVIGQEPQHTVDGSGFTTTIWTQKAKDFTFSDFQIKMIQSKEFLVTFDQFFDFNGFHFSPPF